MTEERKVGSREQLEEVKRVLEQLEERATRCQAEKPVSETPPARVLTDEVIRTRADSRGITYAQAMARLTREG